MYIQASHLAMVHMRKLSEFALLSLSPPVPFSAHSAEPDPGGPAGDDQSAGGRPACRH